MDGYTLKIIGYLLDYPAQDLGGDVSAMIGLMRREDWVPEKTVDAIGAFLIEQGKIDLMDRQEDYVALFDRTPSLSLHLFEHVHGDSRDRGPALVDLDSLYREKGLENISDHTPDYLPMFLEYAALLPIEEAKDTLSGAIDVIAVLGERLKKRESGYAVLFDALQAAAARKPDAKKLHSAMKADSGLPLSTDDMDKAWEEQFAFADLSTDQASGCPQAEDMLARMGIQTESEGGRT